MNDIQIAHSKQCSIKKKIHRRIKESCSQCDIIAYKCNKTKHNDKTQVILTRSRAHECEFIVLTDNDKFQE